MKLLTTDSAELKVSDKKKEIAKIRVRKSENGVKIYFKSKVIHDMFKEMSSGYDSMHISSVDGDGQGVDRYSYNTSSILTECKIARFNNAIAGHMQTAMSTNYNAIAWSFDYDMMNCIPNIHYIAFEGTDKGVTVSINCNLSNRQFDCYVNSVNSYIEYLWQSFCVNKEIESVITTSQVMKVTPKK